MSESQESGWITMTPGILRRTLVSGEKMMQMLVTLDAGSSLPEHQHPHEQIAHVISGRLRLVVAGEPHDLGPGDSLYLASGVPHSAEALEQTVALDTFSPPREDLLAIDRGESV